MKTFKNLICFSLMAMGWLQADMLDNFTKAINSYTTKSLMKSRIKQTALTPLRPILMAFSLILIVKS
ncbi:hypothetical protein AOH249_06850 [Helicobacter pylori]